MRHRGKKDKKIFHYMVGATGFEPVTPAVSRQCSTAELRTQKEIKYSKLNKSIVNYLNEKKLNSLYKKNIN